jgi:hypothetical protein
MICAISTPARRDRSLEQGKGAYEAPTTGRPGKSRGPRILRSPALDNHAPHLPAEAVFDRLLENPSRHCEERFSRRGNLDFKNRNELRDCFAEFIPMYIGARKDSKLTFSTAG